MSTNFSRIETKSESPQADVSKQAALMLIFVRGHNHAAVHAGKRLDICRLIE